MSKVQMPADSRSRRLRGPGCAHASPQVDGIALDPFVDTIDSITSALDPFVDTIDSIVWLCYTNHQTWAFRISLFSSCN